MYSTHICSQATVTIDRVTVKVNRRHTTHMTREGLSMRGSRFFSTHWLWNTRPIQLSKQEPSD